MGLAAAASGLVNGYQRISQRFVLGEFTDDGGAAGHVDFTSALPAGCVFMGGTYIVHTPFTGGAAGNVELTLNKAVDDQLLSTPGSRRVGTVGPNDSSFQPLYNAAAQNTYPAITPRIILTVTTGTADFSLLTVGEITVTLFYATGP